MTTATGGGGGGADDRWLGRHRLAHAGGGGALQISASVAFSRSTALTATIVARAVGRALIERQVLHQRAAGAGVGWPTSRRARRRRRFPAPPTSPRASPSPRRWRAAARRPRWWRRPSRTARRAARRAGASARRARCRRRARASPAGRGGRGTRSWTKRRADRWRARSRAMQRERQQQAQRAAPYRAHRHCGLIIRLAASAYEPDG